MAKQLEDGIDDSQSVVGVGPIRFLDWGMSKTRDFGAFSRILSLDQAGFWMGDASAGPKRAQAVKKPGGKKLRHTCFPLAFLQFVISGSCLSVNGKVRTALFSCINCKTPNVVCIVAVQMLENLNQQAAANNRG